MTGKPFDMLNERQKQCLRLYYSNRDMKEVGSELGLSPNTVKKYLHEACQALGTNRSIQAARLFVEYERDTLGISPPGSKASRSKSVDTDRAAAPAVSGVAARNRYNLTILQRLGMILALAFGAVALAGALLVGAEAITRILVGYEIDISDPPYRD